MKTVNGQTIRLNPENLGPDPEKALKVIVWLPSMLPILLLFVPLFLLFLRFEVPFAVTILIAASLGTFVGMAIYFKRLIAVEDPTLQHKGALLFAHFRLLFASSILYFLCADLSFVLIGAIVAFWLYAEVHHFSTLRRITDAELCAAYPVRFSETEAGDLMYDSKVKVEGVIKEPWYYSKSAEAVLIPITAIVGGFLYIRSFTLRDNFEPRLMIAGCIWLFVAFIVRSSITHFALDIRAVKLKAKGKF